MNDSDSETRGTTDCTTFFDTLSSPQDVDTTINVWRGTSLAGLVAVACSNDPIFLHGPASVEWTALAGKTYYIQVGTYANDFGQSVFNFIRKF